MKFTGAILRIQAVNAQEYISLADGISMLKSGEELEKRVEALEAELGNTLEERTQLQEKCDELTERLEKGVYERTSAKDIEVFKLQCKLDWTEQLVEKLLKRSF